MNKKGKTSRWLIFGVLAVVVLLGFIAFSVTQSVNPNEPNEQNPLGTCDSTTTPSLTIKAIDKDSNTALTEATNLYRIKGEKSWNTFTQGTGFNIGVGKVLEVVMGISTTDWTDNAYGQKFEYTVPCEETPSIEREVQNDEAEDSLTTTFYNADDNAAGEDFSAGVNQVVSLKVQAGSKEVFGNPYLPTDYPNVLCLQLNTTTWDKPNQVYLADGTEMKAVDTPTILSAVAGKTGYCYEMPVITDKQVRIYLDLNPDDTTAPAIDDTAYLYAANWYFNSDTGEIEYGVETEDDAFVGTDAGDSVTLDFTA